MMNYINAILHDNANSCLKNMQDESVDLIITDIPYGISYKSNSQNLDRRKGHTIVKEREEYFERIVGDDTIPLKWLTSAYRILKNNSAIYIFCHWSKWHLLYSYVEDAGFTCKNMIILNKSNHGTGDLKGQYAPKHELLLFATKGRHILFFPEKRGSDIWDAPVKFSGSKRYHPNEKPLSWIEPCVFHSSKEGDLVLDPFAGSGSTGVAAKRYGRSYCLIDIDEKYVEIMKKRLSKKYLKVVE